jgi:hypothetical protein
MPWTPPPPRRARLLPFGSLSDKDLDLLFILRQIAAHGAFLVTRANIARFER